MASTPIKHFVRLGNLLLAEDYVGTRVPIAMAADEAQADWLGWTLERAHMRPVKSWDEANEATTPELPKVDHSPGCFGGRGEVSKTCPACLAERFPNTDDRPTPEDWSAELQRAKESDALLKAVVETGDDATVLGAGQVPMAGRDFDIDGNMWTDKAPDGAPWYAHMDGPCGPECEHKPEQVCHTLGEGGNDRPVAGDRPK